MKLTDIVKIRNFLRKHFPLSSVMPSVVKASKLVNEAYNIQIKIRLGGISKIFCFCSHANMAASDKGISLKRKFLKTF